MTLAAAVCLSLLPCAPALQAEEKQSVGMNVSGGDAVTFSFPKDWKVERRPGPQGSSETLKVSPPAGAKMSLQITLIADQKGKLKTPEELRTALTRGLQPALPGSVEKTATFVTLESKTATGVHATLTDASLAGGKPVPEGEYLTMTFGMLSIGKSTATFTILVNEGGESLGKLALGAVAAVRLKGKE